MNRLLPLDPFAPIFQPLVGQRVGIVDGYGNTGDRIVDAAARHLMRQFGIRWQTINPLADPPGSFALDVILLAGGGSMGGPRECVLHREAGLAWGLPCIVLPQSFHAPEDCRLFARVYVREPGSLEVYPQGILAPDLALGFEWPDVPAAQHDRGVFLSRGGHNLFSDRGLFDPAPICYTPQDYINHVAAYRHVVTDRLHLCITALGLDRKATLLPVAYHKNRSMWLTWLRDLGCLWADTPEAA